MCNRAIVVIFCGFLILPPFFFPFLPSSLSLLLLPLPQSSLISFPFSVLLSILSSLLLPAVSLFLLMIPVFPKSMAYSSV